MGLFAFVLLSSAVCQQFDDNCHISEETIKYSTIHYRFSDFPHLPRRSIVKLQAVTAVTVVEMYGDTQLIVQCNCEADIMADRHTHTYRLTAVSSLLVPSNVLVYLITIIPYNTIKMKLW